MYEARALTQDEINALPPPQPRPHFPHPLSLAIRCDEDVCKQQDPTSAMYLHSRENKWCKGPSYWDRYREPGAATKIHDEFRDYYKCHICDQLYRGAGPNSPRARLTEEEEKSRTWIEPLPDDEIL